MLRTSSAPYKYIFIMGFISFGSVAKAQVNPACSYVRDSQSSNFEVATVKPIGPNGGLPPGIYTYPGGKVVAGSATLKDLIQYAFGVQSFQVVNVPGWADRIAYDVTGIPQDSSPARYLIPSGLKAPLSDEQRNMLKALICDRFHLQIRFESRKAKIFLLTRVNTTSELRETADKAKPPYAVVLMHSDSNLDGELVGENVSMEFLATRLGRYLEIPVKDNTGIKGTYSFDVRRLPDLGNTDKTTVILESVKTLGLRLKATTGQMDVVVVLHADKASAD